VEAEHVELQIVFILTFGFALAGIFGYLAHRIKLSPLLGYLLAGYLIGPYSPGYVADIKISEQLAEIGVVLMMFGVGLHFRIEDLLNVKKIAIPGAIGLSLIATFFGALIVYSLGWSIEASMVLGLSLGVSSTVILVRMLGENNLLHTTQGHIAIGWTLVEDLITIIVLLLVPLIAASAFKDSLSFFEIMAAFLTVMAKFALLAIFMFTIGQKIVSYIISNIVLTRSHELFTVVILAVTFVIATGSSVLFGTSIALGSFIAGMVMGQTRVKHQISANALPLKDAFLVMFFLSMGMLFDVKAIYNNFYFFVGLLLVILIVKPLAAYGIARFLKYSSETAIILAIALAQIGEFSFILVEEASKLKIIPEAGYDIIVACAIVSITLNPFLFKLFLKKTDPPAPNKIEKLNVA